MTGRSSASRLAILLTVLTASVGWFTIAPSQAAAAAKYSDSVVLPLEVIAVNADYAIGWSAMQSRHAAQTPAPRWRELVAKVRQLPPAQRPAAVNRAINLSHYVPDARLWGEDDYWATPGELLSRGGDCEDFAIAKFLLLRDAGFSSSRMLVVVLRAKFLRPAHTILVVETDDGPMVLDNLRPTMYPLTKRLTARMAYAVNDATMLIPRGWALSRTSSVSSGGE